MCYKCDRLKSDSSLTLIIGGKFCQRVIEIMKDRFTPGAPIPSASMLQEHLSSIALPLTLPKATIIFKNDESDCWEAHSDDEFVNGFIEQALTVTCERVLDVLQRDAIRMN